ncbi:BamA/TamA family outer membrane protein, partial [candidate division KSB1 bacterium]|nr:BamA/TamA family outer membrane protein [candidate division KSB1 bacterium]
ERAIIQLRLQGLKVVIPQSFTAGQKLSSILSELTMKAFYPAYTDFNRLKLPFRALACDMVSGEKVLLKEGNLAEAMRASAAFPLMFSPVQKNDMLLVDGGLINNIPVDEVRETGVDIVIAINTTSKLHEKSRLQAPWIIADQVTTIMQREKNRDQLSNADVLISLNMDEQKSDNFDDIDTLIHAGRIEALKKLDKINAIYNSFKKSKIDNDVYRFNQITVSGYSPEVIDPGIRDFILQLTQGPISSEEIYSILEKIYTIGFFDDVSLIIKSPHVIQLNLKQNPVFSRVEFHGNTVFSDSILRNQIISPPCVPINYHAGKKDLKNIIRLYRDSGYSLAQIDNVALRDSVLNIYIAEGIISKIVTHGNNRTSKYVILREFPLQQGDIFNINKALLGINNIHSTGLFNNVSFEIERALEGLVVRLILNEKPFTVVRFGARYDLEQKGKGLLEIADENFLGSGNNISLQGLYGFREQGLNLKFRSDRILNTFLAYQLNLLYNGKNYHSYEEGERIGEYENVTKGLFLTVGQQIKRLGMLSLILSIKNIDLRKIEGAGYPTGRLDLKTISMQSIVDTKDRNPFPRKGKYYRFFYELSSGTFLNSEISYFKIYSSLEQFFTFRKRNTIHPKVSWGASDLTTPYPEQFRIGGLSSFYGLNEDEFVGRYLFLSSLEYRYFFPFRTIIDFYWSVRFDLGATWKSESDIKPLDLKRGIGTRLSLGTPVGPVHFGFGWSSQGKKVAYISAGYQF